MSPQGVDSFAHIWLAIELQCRLVQTSIPQLGERGSRSLTGHSELVRVSDQGGVAC